MLLRIFDIVIIYGWSAILSFMVSYPLNSFAHNFTQTDNGIFFNIPLKDIKIIDYLVLC